MNLREIPASTPSTATLVVHPLSVTASELVVAVAGETSPIRVCLVDGHGGRHEAVVLDPGEDRPVYVELLGQQHVTRAQWSQPSDARATVGEDLPDWHLPNLATVYLQSKAKEPWRQAVLELLEPSTRSPVPVEPGREYQFRILAATHRCDARMIVSVLDASGAVLSTESMPVDPGFRGGATRALYHNLRVRIVVPELGRALRIQLLKGPTRSKRDSYVFAAEPSLHEVNPAGAYDVAVLPSATLASLREEFEAALPTLRRVRVAIPESITSLASREVSVEVQSGSQTTTTAPLVVPTIAVPGGLRGFVGDVGFGWVDASVGAAPSDIVVTCEAYECSVTFEAPDAREPGQLPFRFLLSPAARDALASGARLEIKRQGSVEALTGSPFTVAKTAAWGEVDGFVGASCVGWATSLAALRPALELCVDGVVACTFTPDAPYRPFVDAKRSRASVGFSVALPNLALDGEEHEVLVRVAATGEVLAPGPRAFTFAPVGNVDRTTVDAIEGWIFNPSSMDAPFELEVRVGGVAVGTTSVSIRRTDVAREHGRTVVGFHFRRSDKDIALDAPTAYEIFVAGTETRVLGATRVVVPTFRAIEALARWSSEALRADRSHITDADAMVMELLRTSVVPSLIETWRASMRSGVKSLALATNPPHARPDEARPVDVIVPVYKGYDETLACIESALRARCDVPHRLIVINDASPDHALTLALRELAARSPIVLMENERNLGFVATVNRGMREAETHDVVLLNSDTVVPDGWLDAMTRAAYAAEDIGTVTPLSNRATICSVPLMNVDNDIPAGLDTARMHALCSEHGRGGIVDLPTAVGFCMYIRRDALTEVGFFDEVRWKKGYGEENDFCVRARGLGWRSVLTTDCFVEHHGSVSFAGEKAARVRENGEVLNALYPDYHAAVHAFIAADPIRPLRNVINTAIVRERGQRGVRHVLHVMHNLGGGTQTALEQVAENLLAHGYESLVGKPWGEAGIEIGTFDETITIQLALGVGTARGAGAGAGDLRAQLSALNVELVHVHHLGGFDASVVEAIRTCGVPFVVTAHDYFFACPRVDLRDSAGTFCDLAPASTCEGCVRAAPVPTHARSLLASFDDSVAVWRREFGAFLREAKAVIAPSKDATARLSRGLPGVSIIARAHPESRPLVPLREADVQPHSVAVIGAIGDHKGYRMLLALARYADAIASPLRFTFIGYTRDDATLTKLDNVTITGKYAQEELGELVRDSGATLALFLSTWSETYSYTLSDAFEFGLYPVSLDLGAFRERIEAAAWGEVLAPDIAIADLHARLLEALPRAAAKRAAGAGAGPSDPWRASPANYYEGVLTSRAVAEPASSR